MKRRKIIVVGGVAGGASCAARLRRQDEFAEILMYERGPYVSFANCGLPYYIGGVIEQERDLLVADVELFQQRFNINALINHQVVSIDRSQRCVEVLNTANGNRHSESYDSLVLSPGARPIRPPLPGIDLPGIFSLRTVPDSRTIKEWIESRQVRHALVVGGGFIGLEMVENLRHLGIEVSLVERDSQLMASLDAEMTSPLLERLRQHEVELILADSVSRFEQTERLQVHTAKGRQIATDMVILAIGVEPESELARQAGLELGPRGHILVDKNMRTSDRHIYAVGDVVELRHAVTGQRTAVPLAGPANRQGRIAADVICGKGRHFRGVQGTSVCGLFGMTLAATGVNEKALQASGLDYGVVYAHPNHHVGYYPGAKPIFTKLLFDKTDGRLLGAQAVGEEGVERRIDVIAMAIQMGGSVFDLEEAELCYAPQYGAAKDPVNMVGMIAANQMRGDLFITPWKDLHKDNALVLDVRDADEVSCDPIPGELHIPVNELRARLHELPKDRSIHVCCAVGARAYTAVRLLMQHGFDASLMSGGANTWFCVQNNLDH
ncbi:MAG: FAD-dependent oxidoreductase [Gammaproteobacteria bacterium]|nr:FAD-dependent oxidoreductase [Gammaproteobacteria bacterium]